jgi:hypothetical protein
VQEGMKEKKDMVAVLEDGVEGCGDGGERKERTHEAD